MGINKGLGSSTAQFDQMLASMLDPLIKEFGHQGTVGMLYMAMGMYGAKAVDTNSHNSDRAMATHAYLGVLALLSAMESRAAEDQERGRG